LTERNTGGRGGPAQRTQLWDGQLILASRDRRNSISESLELIIDRVGTPIGEMIIIADDDGNLRAVDWADHEERMLLLLRRHYGSNGFKLEPGKNPYGFADIIKRYFAGDLSTLDALPPLRVLSIIVKA
jgi:hypothetical protein